MLKTSLTLLTPMTSRQQRQQCQQGFAHTTPKGPRIRAGRVNTRRVTAPGQTQRSKPWNLRVTSTASGCAATCRWT